MEPADAVQNPTGRDQTGCRVAQLDSLREMARLFESLPDVQFWIKDSQGQFVTCSRSFAAHFGLSRSEDLVGKTDFDVSLRHLAEEYVTDDRMVLAEGKTLQEKLEQVRESDGSLCWYSTTKVPLRGAQGTVIGTAGTTRKLRGSEARRSLSRDLARAVNEINTNYGKDITLGGLAALAGMPVERFDERFCTTFREAPLKYLDRIRMRAACSLLINSDLPIANVARHCGFGDPGHFAKRFFVRFRIQPLAYRAKYYKR